MKTLIAVAILVAGALTPSQASSIMDVAVDQSFSPTGAIVPNTTQDLLSRWDITAPNVQGIEVLSMTFGMNVVGTTWVQNLSLFVNGSQYGQTIGVPGPMDTFHLSFILPANFTGLFELKGDVGNGTVQTFLTPDGVMALGLTDFSNQLEPDGYLYGPIQQVGTGIATPEPGTIFLTIGGILFLAGKLRRRT